MQNNTENNPENKLREIASKFQIEGTVKNVAALGEGFINDTFYIETEGTSKDYILQRKNKQIFTNVPAMMDNIDRVTHHIREKVVAKGGNIEREVLTLTPTKDGKLFYQDGEGEYWAACELIADTLSYTIAATEQLAFQGGKGIGKFQAQLSDFEGTLVDILPGFHNMRFRFEQFDKAINDNLAGRVAELKTEIEWINSRRDKMMKLWAKVESGEIPQRVTHNDTKISNILFDTNGEVLCVIDLDTVLSSTCLNDYGDSIRSYGNPTEEDDKNLDNIFLDLKQFKSYTQGYLSEASVFLNDAEKKHLVDWALFITFEQTLRFLLDYINGDTYYRIKYPEHNLVRTHAQNKLLCSMEQNYEAMQKIVAECLKN